LKARFSIVFLLNILVSADVSSQEQENPHETEGRHLVSLTTGYSYINEGTELGATSREGFFVPTIGLDYFYKLNQRWELGFVLDWELDHYLIFDQELERNRAVLIGLMGSYKLTKKLSFQLGAGLEFESNENLAVVRTGMEYLFPIGKGWVLGPAFFYNFKQDFSTWSLSAAIGKEF
jgi:hypothetical protein